MHGSTVAANIRAELAARSENQSVLAQLLGLTHSSISRRLRGETEFRADEVGAVAAYLNVPVASLYTPRLRVVGDDTGVAAETSQRSAQPPKADTG